MLNVIELCRLPMRRIPQELADLIIDFIASPDLDDVDGRLHRTETLHACTLVSKAWLPRARKHIFHRVHLRMQPTSVETYPEDDFKRSWLSPEPPTYPTFLSSFRDSPRKLWVEELVIMDLTTNTGVPFMEAMSCMVRVRSITFGGGSPFDDSAHLGGGAGFVHVRHLRLQEISIPSLYTLPRILDSLPILESFTVVWPITFVSYPADERSPKKALIRNHLNLVDISSCPPPFDHLLLNLFTLANVNTLITSPTLSLDDDISALGVLEIDHTHRHLPAGIRTAFPFYDVPKVVVRLAREAELNGYVQALEDVVPRMRAGMRPVMRELHVHVFSLASESERRVWERLDSVLKDIVGLGFGRLVVSCPSKGEAIKKAMKLLGEILVVNVTSKM